jgi:hypothetical protein
MVARWLPVFFAQWSIHAFKLKERSEAASDRYTAPLLAHGTILRQLHELLELENQQYRSGSRSGGVSRSRKTNVRGDL